jgi:hypothetical protein
MELCCHQSLLNVSLTQNATGTVLSQLKILNSFWTPEEIDFSCDMKHLPNLPPDQLHLLSMVLGFFAISNKIVPNNLSQNFMTEVTSLEVQFFYGFQLMMENIHNETYSLLIDTYIKDKKKQNDIYNAIETMPPFMPKQNGLKCGATHNMPHSPNISSPLLLLKASSSLAPSVPSFGLSNMVYSLAYVLQMS